jgi:two-component sensor histidine kinase
MMRTLFELTFRPTLQVLGPMRALITELFSAESVHEDTVYRLGIAVHELLENVIKYSTDGVAHLRAEVSETEERAFVSLRVSNQCEAARLSDLKSEFDSLLLNEDAEAYYLALMLKNARRRDGSGLGLARIWAEARMDLRCEIAGSMATIVARSPIELTTSPTS